MPWTEWEDELLEEVFMEGKSVQELAKIFERKEGTIYSRLKKLGLVEY